MSIANAGLALYDDLGDRAVPEQPPALMTESWNGGVAKALERRNGALARPGTTAP